MIRLSGGHIIDPANGRNEVGDLFIEDGRIVRPPENPDQAESYDITGKIVMAGGIPYRQRQREPGARPAI